MRFFFLSIKHVTKTTSNVALYFYMGQLHHYSCFQLTAHCLFFFAFCRAFKTPKIYYSPTFLSGLNHVCQLSNGDILPLHKCTYFLIVVCIHIHRP
uniref:Uncharacterized protein n=1 Tax=Aegilops tauschii subsp. strangulata TaxID=200361 RepID=A0A453MTG7_AEGTS